MCSVCPVHCFFNASWRGDGSPSAQYCPGLTDNWPAPLSDLCPSLPPFLGRPGSDCWSAEQRRLAEKVLRGDGEEGTVLELTVASVGDASAATLVTSPDVTIN